MNIDQMPAGREMDALVAEKVMGWTPSLSSQGIMWLNKDGEYERGEHTFHPSTDIAAAWEVVEKMRSWGFVSINDHSSFGWSVDLLSDSPTKADRLFPRADTAPLAICRAALKAATLYPNTAPGGGK